MAKTLSINDKSTFINFLTNISKPVFILFTAEFCKPCKFIKPIFIQEAQKTTQIEFYIVDVSEHSDLGIELSITSIPKISVYKSGICLENYIGYDSSKFKALINKYL
jgi:thiol-disulfide isomerase/thioredoxin